MAELKDRLQQALGTHYRLERELTEGAMSRVFLATEVGLSRQVVVKVLPPEAATPTQAERFAREIQVAASLQHPHIVPLLTAGSAEELAWYVMPYLAGETLAARMQRQGAFPVHEAVRILRDIVDALAYSHANGVVHRDIKPGNVLFSGKHALVTDFGVAKALSAMSTGSTKVTGVGVTVGTPTYIAPEQAMADPNVDHRADIYAVGVVAYELLTGRTPFLATTPQSMAAAHVTTAPDPILLHSPSLPPELAGVVMQCLAKRPDDRWQSAEELSTALEPWGASTAGMTPVATPVIPRHRGTDGEFRLPDAGSVAAVFLTVAFVVVGFVFTATRLFGLPDWVWVGAGILMVVGFPIVMYTGRLERRRARAVARGLTMTGGIRPHHQLFTWRRSLTGGGLALGALLLVTIGYVAARTLGIGPAGTLLSSGVVGAHDRFVLADFVNRTDDSTVGTSITEALRVDLGQSEVVKIIGDRDVAAAIQRMTLPAGTPVTDSIALDLARREGAKAVITGDVTPLGTGYVLTARVLDASTGATQTAVRATANDPSKLLAALNDLSAQLRERIGESLRAIRASEPLEQVTTNSLEALRHYSAAARAGNASDWGTARTESEAAIAADPKFALAYLRLSAALNNSNAPRSQVIAAERQAFEHRDRLPPLERALTEASYYSDVVQEPERAVAAMRAVLAIDSLHPVASSMLAGLLVQMDRYPEAEEVARRVPAARMRQSTEQFLFVSLVSQRKWAAAESLAQVAESRWRDGAMVATYYRAEIANARHDLPAVGAVLRAAPPTVGSNSVFAFNVELQTADLALAEGRMEAGMAAMERMALQRQEESGPGAVLGLLSYQPYTTLVARGDTALARRQLAELLRRHPLDSIPPEDLEYEILRDLYAKLGERGELRRLRARLEEAIPVGQRVAGDSLGWELADAEARGDQQAALDLVRRWRMAAYCTSCRLVDEATWWERSGRGDSALAVLERSVGGVSDGFRDNYIGLYYGPGLYRAAGLAESQGDRAKAREYYQRFIDAWRNAEPAFRPQVAEAKRRLAALGSDAPRP
jgi:tRNA A-37 threonylcarbamoyl transferase component Bud32/tetratricopeptide (TPR) repeat protein